MKDLIKILDRLFLRHGKQALVAGPVEDKEEVQIRGFFSSVCRERGKIVPGTRREGYNIFTLTGREYVARVISYSSYSPLTPARNDRVRYIGFGIGTTPEVSSVSRVVSPIAYTSSGGDRFLADLAIPTYPFQTSGSFGTSVRYTREFSELELSISGTVTLTEAGLFTDGSPTATVPFTPGTRNLTLAQAGNQAPIAYKTFEPFPKTQNFVLQAAWELRL
jgi:hypothetical protein